MNKRSRTRDLTNFLTENFKRLELWSKHGMNSDTIPFTNDFPRADIHELIAPDLLHQVIKGTFKDHLVACVGEFLVLKHGARAARRIMDDIDHRISLVPPFSGLRRFPEGRGFKQWTGDDSKALMKIYLPALEGHIPTEVIWTFRSFLDFCYVTRQNTLTDEDIVHLEHALEDFHCHRQIFIDSGIREDISLPRQHSLCHYPKLIQLFGAPNGLCSSITESKHIRAVKEPWRHSNRNEPLEQILLINQRLDKLSAARTYFTMCGMFSMDSEMDPSESHTDMYNTSAFDSNALPLLTSFEGDNSLLDRNEASNKNTNLCEDENEDIIEDFDNLENDEAIPVDVEVKLAKRPKFRWTVEYATEALHMPNLLILIRQFLYEQLFPDSKIPILHPPIHAYPIFNGKLSIYYTASVRFISPSESLKRNRVYMEYIRATPCWRVKDRTVSRYDMVFVSTNPSLPGLRGFEIARVMVFVSFLHEGQLYQCAIVQWFSRSNEDPDPDTGLWIVKPDFDTEVTNMPYLSLIPIGSIYRTAHLIPRFRTFVDHRSLTPHDTLDAFCEFYVNKYIDYHTFQLISE